MVQQKKTLRETKNGYTMNASVMSILSRIDELDEKQIAEIVKRSNLFLNTRKVSEPAQATSSATSRGMKRKLKSR